MFINRGNHEAKEMNRTYGFEGEANVRLKRRESYQYVLSATRHTTGKETDAEIARGRVATARGLAGGISQRQCRYTSFDNSPAALRALTAILDAIVTGVCAVGWFSLRVLARGKQPPPIPREGVWRRPGRQTIATLDRHLLFFIPSAVEFSWGAYNTEVKSEYLKR